MRHVHITPRKHSFLAWHSSYVGVMTTIRGVDLRFRLLLPNTSWSVRLTVVLGPNISCESSLQLRAWVRNKILRCRFNGTWSLTTFPLPISLFILYFFTGLVGSSRTWQARGFGRPPPPWIREGIHARGPYGRRRGGLCYIAREPVAEPYPHRH